MNVCINQIGLDHHNLFISYDYRMLHNLFMSPKLVSKKIDAVLDWLEEIPNASSGKFDFFLSEHIILKLRASEYLEALDARIFFFCKTDDQPLHKKELDSMCFGVHYTSYSPY